MNSRNKGKTGELEAAEFLRECWGIEARRAQQYRGTETSFDLVTSLCDVNIEVKRREREHVRRWVEEAQMPGVLGVVLHRPNRASWIVSLPADGVPLFNGIYRRAGGKVE